MVDFLLLTDPLLYRIHKLVLIFSHLVDLNQNILTLSNLKKKCFNAVKTKNTVLRNLFIIIIIIIIIIIAVLKVKFDLIFFFGLVIYTSQF